MKPAYSESHRAFIKSLPCSVEVCRSRFTVPAHTPGFGGARGMRQKRSDFETIPLCEMHHDEQHLIGWAAFSTKYGLDIRSLLTILSVKPRISKDPPDALVKKHYWMDYQQQTYMLSPISDGLKRALAVAQEFRREWLIDNVFQPREKAS